MAVSGKYGKVAIANIGDDEPIFILRAQDNLAQSAIIMYQALAASNLSRRQEWMRHILFEIPVVPRERAVVSGL